MCHQPGDAEVGEVAAAAIGQGYLSLLDDVTRDAADVENFASYSSQ